MQQPDNTLDRGQIRAFIAAVIFQPANDSCAARHFFGSAVGDLPNPASIPAVGLIPREHVPKLLKLADYLETLSHSIRTMVEEHGEKELPPPGGP